MTNLISHYGLPTPAITNWFIQTAETYFEIEDTNTGEIVLHKTRGSGMGRFSNIEALNITVFNYDKFITSIRDEPFQLGRKRCDILLDSSNQRCFILGEIKDKVLINPNKKKKVRSEAKKQLLSSLKTILEVAEIIAHINQKEIKRCCYFNKQSASPTALNATTAFNRLSEVYPDGFMMSKPDIENLGFEFYEYTGEQTMVLSN